MKLGVFDSGRGGEAVAERLGELLPEAVIVTANDAAHVPYGGRSADEIISLTQTALAPLLEADCDAIIIACNTATTVAIRSLRETYPQQTFIGIEPMVKPAARLTQSGVIAVLATPATLASPRYHELKDTWAKSVKVIEPDCSTWAGLIETDMGERVPVEQTIRPLLAKDVDVIVLACTHYHWLKPRIQALAGPDVTILEPSDAIKNRIESLLN